MVLYECMLNSTVKLQINQFSYTYDTKWKGGLGKELGTGVKLFYISEDGRMNIGDIIPNEETNRGVLSVTRRSDRIIWMKVALNGEIIKKKVWFYIALYPVRWTAQSALHFPPLADLFIPTPFSASLGSILAMQQLRNDYSLTFPPLSIARYSFIQLSRLRRREVKENAQTSKR